MKLSEHFELEEFTVSQTAVRLGIQNMPSPLEIENLIELCVHVLEPVRRHFGPIKISSGYRSLLLNKQIGGAKNSQHTTGEASDFLVMGHSVQEIFDWIRQSDLPFDQVIQEFGSWVHVSHSQQHNRRQSLYAKRVGGKTVYANA